MRFTKQIVLSFLLLSSFLNAEIIRNVSSLDSRSICITNDYYLLNDRFYFYDLTDSAWYSTGGDDYIKTITPGWKFDTDTKICTLDDHNILGLTITDFNFLLALVGSFVGFTVLFFTIKIFISVGGGRRWS
jgi:hypothetical protein